MLMRCTLVPHVGDEGDVCFDPTDVIFITTGKQNGVPCAYVRFRNGLGITVHDRDNEIMEAWADASGELIREVR